MIGRNLAMSVLLTTTVLTGLTMSASPVAANPNCAAPENLILGHVAVGHANPGQPGESHWYRLDVLGPAVIVEAYVGSQTAMQVVTPDCATLLCNVAQELGPCLVNGGSWRIRVWSDGGSDYAVVALGV
jgi:hypothetical protein